MKRRVRHRDKRLPILPLVGIGVAMSKPIQNAVAGDYTGAIAEMSARFTGYNPQSGKVDIGYAAVNGYLPIVAGIGGSMAMDKLGVNKKLRNVPFVGKYVKL